MLRSITEDNSNLLAKQASGLGITRRQIVQIIANSNGSVSLFWDDEC